MNIIIDSAHNVVKNYPDVMYVIIGDHRDPNRSKEIWEEKVKQRGLESNFKFLVSSLNSFSTKFRCCASRKIIRIWFLWETCSGNKCLRN